MRAISVAREPCPRRQRLTGSAVALLAVAGVLAGFAPAAQATSSPVANWTRQHPASHPLPSPAAVAYDAAAGNVVLFGARVPSSPTVVHDNGTWTWDGSTWTRQHPATSPPDVNYGGALMAYDAATGTVVLWDSGHHGGDHETWTWDGSTWTQQHPATHPLVANGAAMAYDPATSTVVLFGGETRFHQILNETWTWDGSNWTLQHPVSSPPARYGAAIAYDAATSSAVLFGGARLHRAFADTWTWDGSTWTQQAPAAHPSARDGAAMTYDAATSSAVLFGGLQPSSGASLGDTWTWDGSTWTKQAPAASPLSRCCAAMTYDAATSSAVLFGGVHLLPVKSLDDTWTWG